MYELIKKPICPFISSTFKDFQEERDYLVKHIFPELQQKCKEKYTYFAPIDLRWGINKNQSQAGKVISLCLDYIKLGSPYFICLLGNRYGYHYTEEDPDIQSKEWFEKNIKEAVSQGHEWVQEHTDKSITELEIICALEQAKCTKCFFYFRDEAFFESKYPNPTPEQITTFSSESEYSKRKLKLLKDNIMERHSVSTFRTPQQLGEHILRDMSNVIDTDCRGDMKVELPHLPHHLSERIHNLQQPKREMILAHHLFERNRGDADNLGSFGTNMIVELDKHANSIGSDSKPILLLTGDQGCGKSSLLARWALQYKSEHPLITHYIGCSTYSRDLSHMIESILLILDTEPGEQCQDQTLYTSSEWSTLQDNIEQFNRVINEHTFVLVIDCLEALSADSDHTHVLEDFTWLPSKISKNCRIIISCTEKSDHYTNFHKNYKNSNYRELRMPGITKLEERQEVVTKQLERYCKHLDHEQLSLICNTHLSHNPMYLIAVANELRVFGVWELVDNQIEKIVKAATLHELWYNIFIRWCRDYGWSDDTDGRVYNEEPYGWVQDALCLIAMSRRGLTEVEILGALELMGYKSTLVVTTAAWASFYRAAQESLITQPCGMITLAHGCVQKAVLCSVMGAPDQVSPSARYAHSSLQRLPSTFRRSHDQYHLNLARYFEGQPQSWRMLEELPWHWAQGRKWRYLHKVVSTPNYFEDFRSSAINQFNTFKNDLFRYWEEMKQYAPKLPSAAQTYEAMVRVELCRELELVHRAHYHSELVGPGENSEQVRDEASFTELVAAAITALAEEDKVKLATTAWLTGQFLGEICDYEPGTNLLSHAVKLCPKKNYHLLYQIHYSLGKVYYYKIEWEKARGSFTDAKEALKKTCTPDNQKIEEQCALFNNTVSCLLIMKRLEEAEKMLQETKVKFDEIGHYNRSPGYYMYRFNYSMLLTKKANKVSSSEHFEKALEIFEECIQFRKRHYGWRHPLVAQNWQEKGLLYKYWKKNQDSKHCFEEALRIYQDVLSADHVLIATCQYHLGMIYEEQHDWTRGYHCFKIALDIRKKRFLSKKKKSWQDIERRLHNCEKHINWAKPKPAALQPAMTTATTPHPPPTIAHLPPTTPHPPPTTPHPPGPQHRPLERLTLIT